MGLFDGAADGTPSSTADIARLLDAPVVLVVDASAQSTSVAALVHGFATYDPRVRLAGVILDRVASDGHEQLLREALDPSPVPVLGALRHDGRLEWRDRHLGLVPVAEHPAEVARALGALAEAITAGVDLEAVVALARSAPARSVGPVALTTAPPPARPGAGLRTRIAVATGAAFTFTYTDTLEVLEASGAEIVPFDPLRAAALPEAVDGLLAGGGFPEVHAAELAANQDLLGDVRRRVTEGLPTWAECGGLLWLARSLDGHRMAGVLDTEAHMTGRLTLGYRRAVSGVPTPLGPSGTELRGHEFHYSTVDAPGEALELSSRWGSRREGHATPTLLATYLHHHPGGDPRAVAAFVDTCATRARARARLP
jgi:cobyrinic acid a,c-diamide synthase